MKKNILTVIMIMLFPLLVLAQEKSKIVKEKEPIAAYKIDNKWHVIDDNGNLIFDPINLYRIGSYGEGMILAIRLVEGRKRWTYINMDGEFVFDFKADGARPFKGGRAKVYSFIDRRKEIPHHSYYNKKGELIIDNGYLDASVFSEGVAWVMNYEERGLIDTNGKFIWKPQGKAFALPFVEGFLKLTNEDGDVGYLNRNFDTICEFKYLEGRPFSDGLAMVRDFGKIVYIDTLGNVAVNTTRHLGKDFHDGYAFTAELDMQHRQKWQVVNKQGLVMTEEVFADVKDFHDGVACVQDFETKKWKFIDPYGNKIFDQEFEDAESMINGLAFVKDDEAGIYGYIDNTGELVLPLPKADAYVDFRVNIMH
jgi:hypothetical protein